MQVDALVAGNMQESRAKMLLLDLQNSINMGKLKQPLPPHTLAQLPVPLTCHTYQLSCPKLLPFPVLRIVSCPCPFRVLS